MRQITIFHLVCVLSLCALVTNETMACANRHDVATVMRRTNNDRYMTQVICQAIKQGQLLKNRGFKLIPSFSLLGRIKTRSRMKAKPMTLRGGREYVFVGACDSDCTDLDIAILNPSGSVVAKDLGHDDIPVVRYKPRRTGKFAVVAILSKCKARQCAYSVLGYSR